MSQDFKKSDADRRSVNPTISNAQGISSKKNKKLKSKSAERDGGVRNLDLINDLADQGVSESVQQQ